jgi:8-oxo-dGTP diphosphatase
VTAARPPRQVAVAVVVRGSEVLVGRRDALAADAAGCDEFPGGLVEPGESPQQAAARECREEAGIGVTVGDLIATATADSSRGPIEIRFFRCRPDNAALPRAPFAWTPAAGLDPARFPAPNRPVIALVRAEAARLPDARGPQGGS